MSKISGKLERILKFKPLKDKQGRYIPYCDYGWPQGLIRYAEECEARKCTHYKRLYLDKA